MPNPEHAAKIEEGIPAWNEWRVAHRDTFPDLSQMDFRGANLAGAILSDVNLSGANLVEANLSGASLSGVKLTNAKLKNANLCDARLNQADFSGANLFNVNLTFANLSFTNLSLAFLNKADISQSNLSGADFSDASLSQTDLSGSDLNGAKFSGARFDRTILANLDLSHVTGLESVKHSGPSRIGVDTVYKSKGKIPAAFLRGCGMPEDFINYIPALVGATEPIEFYSVFISYSSKDQAFAERLYADLQSKKVRCWFAPEDLKIGDKFRVTIDESIRVYDKLLLVLSEHSVGSAWVESEVESAMEKERQQKRTMLFPIRLDDAVTKEETGWPADVRRTRHIGDFQNWKDHDAYQKAFNRLMRDLKADEKKP